MFNRLDQELAWPGELMSSNECPPWIRYTQEELDQAVFATSKAAQSIIPEVDDTLGRGQRSVSKLNALDTSAVSQSAPIRSADDFIDRTGIVYQEDQSEDESDEEVVGNDDAAGEDIIDIDKIEENDEDDEDETATINTMATGDTGEDSEEAMMTKPVNLKFTMKRVVSEPEELSKRPRID